MTTKSPQPRRTHYGIYAMIIIVNCTSFKASGLVWLADEIQGFLVRNNIKKYYDNPKGVFGPTTTGISQLFSKDGATLLTDKAEILGRLTEYSDCVLIVNDRAIGRIFQIRFNHTLDRTLAAANSGKTQMQCTSFPGAAAILGEFYK